MTAELFPERAPSRAWLVTLADLALLLVGFFVLLQAHQAPPAREIVRGIAAGLGAEAPALPVAAEQVAGFAPGGAVLAPGATDALLAWARDVSRDPRVALRVTGAADGSAADRDPATGSAALLAADRARAVAAALAAAGIAADRLSIATAAPAQGRGRHVIVTLAFAGEPGKQP